MVNGMILCVEADKEDLLDQRRFVLADSLYGYLRSFELGIAVDSCTDVGEGDRTNPVSFCKLQGMEVAVAKLLGLAPVAAVPSRTDRVNHFLCGQFACGSDDGFADLAAALSGADLPTFVENRGASGPMYRSIYPAASQKGGIGCIDDRIDFDLGDVTSYELDIHCMRREDNRYQKSDFECGKKSDI